MRPDDMNAPDLKKVAAEITPPLRYPHLNSYMRTVSQAFEAMVTDRVEHFKVNDIPEVDWLMPLYALNKRLCTRKNHPQGLGCVRPGQHFACSWKCVCVLCGSESHGVSELHPAGKYIGQWKCGFRTALDADVDQLAAVLGVSAKITFRLIVKLVKLRIGGPSSASLLDLAVAATGTALLEASNFTQTSPLRSTWDPVLLKLSSATQNLPPQSPPKSAHQTPSTDTQISPPRSPTKPAHPDLLATTKNSPPRPPPKSKLSKPVACTNISPPSSPAIPVSVQPDPTSSTQTPPLRPRSPLQTSLPKDAAPATTMTAAAAPSALDVVKIGTAQASVCVNPTGVSHEGLQPADMNVTRHPGLSCRPPGGAVITSTVEAACPRLLPKIVRLRVALGPGAPTVVCADSVQEIRDGLRDKAPAELMHLVTDTVQFSLERNSHAALKDSDIWSLPKFTQVYALTCSIPFALQRLINPKLQIEHDCAICGRPLTESPH
jgi:hypothetical protein